MVITILFEVFKEYNFGSSRW